MNILDNITKRFVEQSQTILEDNLVGIYLHGSAAMGCFNQKRSDIDLIVVVNTDIPNEIKLQYMDMALELNKYGPKKGLEFSIVKKEVCNPFVYPTPFALHYSNAHLEWYETNPFDYIDKMNGTDRDLASHFTIIYHRGKCLFGKPIQDVLDKVSGEFYFDSIWCDVKDAEEKIMESPVDIILNLCRVLAYRKDGLILSKQEGAEWGLDNVPERFHPMILQARNEYLFNEPIGLDKECACHYAAYMINQIRS